MEIASWLSTFLYPDRYALMIGIVTFVTIVIYQRNKPNNLPPCYGGWIPWLGCAIEFGKCPLYFMEECRRKLGPVFTLKVAGRRMTFITELEDFKYFFTSDSVDFQQAVKDVVEKAAAIPEGVFRKNHIRMHDTLKCGMAQPTIATYCQRIQTKFNKNLRLWGDEGEDDLLCLIRGAMYKSVLDTLFGNNVLPTSPEDTYKLLEKHFIEFDANFEYASRIPAIFLKKWNTSKWWLLNLFKKTVGCLDSKRECAQYETLFEKVVNNVEGPYAANFSLLLMWASLANAIPITFWAAAFIFTNEEIHGKVKQEVREALANNKDDGGNLQVTVDDLARMPYLKRCVIEAIRVRAPGVITRGVKKPLCVKGYTIPAGDMLMLSPYWTQHNPKYFPDPDRFMPDRWISADPENVSFLKGFVAFGGGRYQCPGRWFALMEIQLFLAFIVYKFDITPLDPIPKHSPLHVVGSQQPETAMTVRYTVRSLSNVQNNDDQ